MSVMLDYFIYIYCLFALFHSTCHFAGAVGVAVPMMIEITVLLGNDNKWNVTK